MLVKICGITRQEDADAAVEAGALAIGFVFWPGSPRFIDPYRARAIARALPPFVTAVGVFVNQALDYVNAVGALLPLGAVQLHGDEAPAFAARARCHVLKAVVLGPSREPSIDDGRRQTFDQWPAQVTLLADVDDPVRRGGTGRTVDWSAAAELAARRRLILAGGLNPDNVASAVTDVRPFAIDVSSGVERSPGVKDPARIRALFEALRGAAAGDSLHAGMRTT
jgi:phosphoribosylanthranilate isomerase